MACMLAMSFIQTRHLFCRFSWWYQKQVRRNACPRRYYRIKGLQLRDALFCWTDRRMPTLTLPWTRLPKTWRNKIESAELTVITIPFVVNRIGPPQSQRCILLQKMARVSFPDPKETVEKTMWRLIRVSICVRNWPWRKCWQINFFDCPKWHGCVTTANASCIDDGVGLRIMTHLAHAFCCRSKEHVVSLRCRLHSRWTRHYGDEPWQCIEREQKKALSIR